MKLKFILICLSVLTVFIVGCTPSKPESSFRISTYSANTYDNVYFTNTSYSYSTVYWDFGDGFTSTLPNPTHYYDHPGNYTVKLTVSARGYTSTSYKYISIYKTDLDIRVMDNVTGYPIFNCDVTLYSNNSDLTNLINPIIAQYTSIDGYVYFPNLGSIVYYVDCYKYDGYGHYINDLSYRTDPLIMGGTNPYNFYLNYYSGKALTKANTNRPETSSSLISPSKITDELRSKFINPKTALK